MSSEIRANTLKNRVGLGTVSFTNTGIVVSGIVTANSFSGPYNGTDIVGTGITLTSTDAGSSAGPELKLFRNSASPADADYLGQLKFAGESDTGVERNYAKITGKILDASNGTEDGILEFAHIKAGSQTITGRWRSDSLQLLNGTNLSVAGDTTLTGDLDVDRHTNLDNVSIAGITTGTIFKVPDATNAGGATNHIAIGDNSDLLLFHDNNGNAQIFNSTGHLTIVNNTSGRIINLQPKSGANGIIARYEGAAELYHNNVKRLETTSVGVSIPQDLDVDGHTNLDNVSVAGVSTFTGDLNIGSSVGRFDSSGIIKTAHGTASAPSHTFINDPDNGMYRPTTNTLGFVCGGDEYFRITSDGKFSLGNINATPSAALHLDWDTNNMLMLDNNSASTQKIQFANNASIHAQIFGTSASGGLTFDSDPSNNHNNSFLNFVIDGSTKAYINSSGQMGLGIVSPQANAKLQVVGRVGATEFYTTTTSTPQTDFTSSVSSNKAGLLLHRLSETDGDYGGLEFHGHPSSITSYRKGGIYYKTTGSGFGRGDIVFANDTAADSNNVSPSDHKFVIKNNGSLRAYTNSNGVASFSNHDHGNVDFNHRSGRVLHSNGTGWDGNANGDGTDPILVLAVEDRAGNSDIGDAYGLCLHSESDDDNDYAPMIGWSVKSNSGNFNTTIAAIVAQKKAQAVDHNWSSGDLHFFTNKPAGYQGGYMNNVADMTITQHGYVTMPRQPVFSAVSSVTRSAGFIVFNQTSCNVGNHYSTSNGRFTAPVAGSYFFSFYGMSPNNNTSNQRCAFYINGSYHSSGQYIGGVGYSGYTNGGYTHLTMTTVLSLNANDYVQVDWQYADLHDNHNKFSGFLVG